MIQIPLYQKIKNEILEDTYMSSRIDVAEIEKLMVGCSSISELNNINDMDYLYMVSLACISMDIADFFLFSRFEHMEDFKIHLLEKVELNNLKVNTPKRILWTEYAISIILYLELDFKVPDEYKIALVYVLKKIIELYGTYEELTGTLKEIGNAYTIFFKKIILKKGNDDE